MSTNQTHEVLTGICSCCLGRFVVEGTVPVLHGYKRPGDGAIHGNCNGMRFPMYEISTEGCIWMRDGLLNGAAACRDRAKSLRSGKEKTLHLSKQVYEMGGYKTISYTLTKKSSKDDLYAFYCYSWEELVEKEAASADRNASMLESQAATFQKYIDAWKPGMEFVSEDRLNAEKLEAREEKARLAAQKRRFKALKAAFFHLGAAISKHKKGWLHAEWDWEQSHMKHDSKRATVRYADVHRLAPFAQLYPQYAKKAKA